MGAINDIILDLQVFQQKFGAVDVVGHNAPYLGRCQKNVIGALLLEEFAHGALIT